MPTPSIFVIGDSISIQYGPFLEKMVAGKFVYRRKEGLGEALKNLDIPEGANGGDSQMCRKYVEGLLASGAFQTDVLLLNCGLHDVKIQPEDPTRALQISITEYRENLVAILAAVKKLGCQFVWIRTTPVDEAQHNRPGMSINRTNKDVDAYNAVADDVMAAHGIPSIDLHGFVLSLGTPAETLHDGRHFHEPIRQLQAAFINGWLQGWYSGKA